MSRNCKECGTQKEVYYVTYCPKCDIQKIIKDRHNSIAIIPVLDYGEDYVDGFDKDVVWDQIRKNDQVRNDVYIDYYLGNNVGDNMLRKVFDELKVLYENDTVFLSISW
jgi:hypothetical protein